MADIIEKILISCNQPNFQERVREFCNRRIAEKAKFQLGSSEEEQSVLKIHRSVAEKGDKAVQKLTHKYDHVNLHSRQFRIQADELERAHKETNEELLHSIKQAIENVRKYQEEIFIGDNKYPGLKYTPIERVGICVPGAAAPLLSTVIMTAVPAQVAGVKEIVIVSPPRYKGSIHPLILSVCFELGIEEVYRIGGAQAVAALALGTETVKKVNMIAGPGNIWVQIAKKYISGDYAAIDSIAGPSEVLIIADKQANASWIAADMLSQAEHAENSWAVVVTDSELLAGQVREELREQLTELSRKKQAEKSLADFGAIVVEKDQKSVVDFANNFAAEHLQILCGEKSKEIAELIENAGAIFIGEHTPVAVGDYWAGPSHTLPTGQAAKFSSALTSNDFLKSISIIEFDKEKLAADAEHIIRLAQAEGLDAHAKSVKIRQEKM
ncbi:MAG: histidinol dehydrogenase [Planctomycetota bacterium]